MAPDLLQRVKGTLEELRRFAAFGGLFFRFRDPGLPLVDKGVCRFCVGCVRHARAGGLCQNSVYAAAVQGFAVGDVWYTRCWLGVDAFVVPVAPDNDLVGAIEVGGYFTPGETDRSQERVLTRLASLDSHGTLEEFVSGLQGMREAEFLQIRAAAEFLLQTTFAKGLNQEREFTVRRQIFRAQQKLSERVQQAAPGSPDPHRVTERLLALLRSLASSDLEPAPRLLDEFLAELFLSTGGDLVKFKGGLLPFLAFIAQSRLQRGESWHPVLGGFEKHLLKLEKFSAVQEACAWAESLLLPEAVSSFAAELPQDGLLEVRILDWIRRHHAEKVSLEAVARALGISRSSLVHRLKRESGHTFGELLTGQRVCEAKRLLAFTNLTIGEVSARCGFRDQSYFTKVFREEINLTPREFRRLLTVRQTPEESLAS